MASYLVGDGVTDVAVSFDDDEAIVYIASLQWTAASVNFDLGTPPNITTASTTPLGFLLSDTLENDVAAYIGSLQRYAYDDANVIGDDNLVGPNVNASLNQGADTLQAALGAQASITATASLIEGADTLQGALVVPTTLTSNLVQQGNTLTASVTWPLNAAAILQERNDTLTASLGVPTNVSGALSDGPDSLSATITIPFAVSGVLQDDRDTINAVLGVPVQISGSLQENPDSLSAALGSTLVTSGTLNEASDYLNAELLTLVAPQGNNRDGVDGGNLRRKKPVIMYRPKVEAKLEQALEELGDVRASARVSQNKKRVKAALEAVRQIEAPPSYAAAISNIETALKNVSRETAKHQGMMNALLSVAMKMKALISEMQQKRAEQKRRNMEKLLWLI